MNQACTEIKSAQEILVWAVNHYPQGRLAMFTSFGAEDQVLLDMLSKLGAPMHYITLDTGRLFPETYDVIQKSIDRYHIRVESYAPDPKELAALVENKGPNLFYFSIEGRRACCTVRKLNPLKSAMAGLDAWICGLRREQSSTRSEVQPVERDADSGVTKISPLYAYSEGDVWNYIRENKVPYNKLHDQGFPSIGCAPCTRAVAPGEDIRSGRWWWESPEHKECGLHNRPQTIAKAVGNGTS